MYFPPEKARKKMQCKTSMLRIRHPRAPWFLQIVRHFSELQAAAGWNSDANSPSYWLPPSLSVTELLRFLKSLINPVSLLFFANKIRRKILSHVKCVVAKPIIRIPGLIYLAFFFLVHKYANLLRYLFLLCYDWLLLSAVEMPKDYCDEKTQGQRRAQSLMRSQLDYPFG